MCRILRAFTSILALLILSSAVFAQSQATTGLIQGTVVDPNDALIAGATINVKNTETGLERTVTSNSDGFFSVPLLPLGKYRVTTTATGFANSILENVEVSIGQTQTLKLKFSSKTKKRVKKVIKDKKSTAKVTVTGTDAAGNSATTPKLKIKVKK